MDGPSREDAALAPVVFASILRLDMKLQERRRRDVHSLRNCDGWTRSSLRSRLSTPEKRRASEAPALFGLVRIQSSSFAFFGRAHVTVSASEFGFKFAVMACSEPMDHTNRERWSCFFLQARRYRDTGNDEGKIPKERQRVLRCRYTQIERVQSRRAERVRRAREGPGYKWK